MRSARVAELVGAVAQQALADWGAGRVALLDDGSPEATLAGQILERALSAERLVRVGEDPELESLLHVRAADRDGLVVREEARRARARLLEDALTASAANKTALLLGGPLPPEPLLPLGDLWASEVEELVGGWSAPPPVVELARRAGGIHRLDEALRARVDGRDREALRRLGAALQDEVERALARGASSRLTLRLVPKIGHRTLGVDLHE